MRKLNRWPIRSGKLLVAVRCPSWIRSVPFGFGLCDCFRAAGRVRRGEEYMR